MKKALLTLFLVLAAIYFMSGTVFAAWTQAKGHAYNQLTYSYYVTSEKFTTLKYSPSDGGNSGTVVSTGGEIEKVKTAKFSSEGFTYYGEYGIIDSLTVFTAIPVWKWVNSDDTIRYGGERGPGGVGDIDLGLRHNLTQDLFGTGIVTSLQGAVKIPSAYEYKDPLDFLSLGDGQYDATFLLQFGRGIGKGWMILQGGYKFRFENDRFGPISFKPSDQVLVSWTGAYGPIPLIEIRGSVNWAKSVGDAYVSEGLVKEWGAAGNDAAKYQDNVLIRDTLGLEPDSLTVGLDLAFNIKPKWQTVVSYSTDIAGFSVFKSKDWSLGETYSIALVYMY
ncbi:MAG: hypothetical protein HY758_08160 [Nitrospirae bacterium]|nr:hypothetical protein [Nitrospirota bacterium]